MKKDKKILSTIFMVIMLLFFYAPIVYTVIFSFNNSRSLTKWGGFSLQWYEKMFASSDMMDAIGYTIVIAVLATIISTIVGTITAIGLSKNNKIIKMGVERIND
ncbi:MAG: ABC transporter permease, partial [Anaerotignaceae bacterium]